MASVRYKGREVHFRLLTEHFIELETARGIPFEWIESKDYAEKLLFFFELAALLLDPGEPTEEVVKHLGSIEEFIEVVTEEAKRVAREKEPG